LEHVQNLELLLKTVTDVKSSVLAAKNVGTVTKHPYLLKLGLSLTLLPEPFTTALGLPIVAYSLSKRNTVGVGEEMRRSYAELWSALSWP